MRALGTNNSAFTARIGLGGYPFGYHGTTRLGLRRAVLICNQGVGGSSPSGGTAFSKEIFAQGARTHEVAVPILGTSIIRCASVPRVSRAQPPHLTSYCVSARKRACGIFIEDINRLTVLFMGH
jgi:hypothetical protein